MNRLCMLLLVFVLPVPLLRAQTGGSGAVANFPAFKLIDGDVDADGLPKSGAKLCLSAQQNICYQMPSNNGYSHTTGSDAPLYDYGLEPRSELLPLSKGGSLVLFSSVFSGGGSGTLESLAVLKYNGNGKIVNLLPFVGVTNQSDHAMWSIPTASDYPLLVTADFEWNFKDETHFAPHFYKVQVYRYDTGSDRYAKVLSYRTTKRYAGLDQADHIRVLEPERREIMRRLLAITGR